MDNRETEGQELQVVSDPFLLHQFSIYVLINVYVGYLSREGIS